MVAHNNKLTYYPWKKIQYVDPGLNRESEDKMADKATNIELYKASNKTIRHLQLISRLPDQPSRTCHRHCQEREEHNVLFREEAKRSIELAAKEIKPMANILFLRLDTKNQRLASGVILFSQSSYSEGSLGTQL